MAGTRHALRVARRLVVVLVVGGRYLIPALAHRRGRGRVAADACRAAHALGSTYLKFGQLIASSGSLVGDDVADAFRSCLDVGPAVPRDKVVGAVEAASGRPIEQTYASFLGTPVGTASVAVVHRAVTRSEETVAVKVRRPGIRPLVEADVAILRGSARLLKLLTRSAEMDEVTDLIEDFHRNMKRELDLMVEGRSIERIGARLAAHGFTDIVVPRTYPALSNDAVLVMSFLEGVAIDDLDGIERLGVDAGEHVDALVRAWLTTSLVDGEFHGDCHAGNVLVLPDGRIGLIDWGIVGTLDTTTRQFLLSLLEAARGDEAQWEDVAERLMALYGEDTMTKLRVRREDLGAALRQLLAPVLTQPFGQMSLAETLRAGRTAIAERAEPTTATVGATVGAAAADRASFDEGFLLWLKQLLLFERYARLHARTASVADIAAHVLPLVDDLRLAKVAS